MDMKGLSFWPDPRAMSVFKELLGLAFWGALAELALRELRVFGERGLGFRV